MDETKASKKTRGPARVTAETLATKQRDISVSEFFAKNRHLLGFDNPRKALLTTVKEAVDNSLDACEEASILPDIAVVIEDLQPDRAASAKSSRYRVTVVDNGPGIIRAQVENVFGRLLFGSKFHRLKMSRGQQGIGISAAGMYGLITTGKPMLIQTRPKANRPAHHIELAMNTKTNRAEVTLDEETEDFPLARLRDLGPAVRELSEGGGFLSLAEFPTGTSVSIELDGKYQRGRGSVDEFLELTAIANPHARITLVRPTRVTDEEEDVPLLLKRAAKIAAPEAHTPDAEGRVGLGGKAPAAIEEKNPAAPAITLDLGPLVVFPRNVNALPPETKEIQPHPRGVELGTLLQMIKDYEAGHKSETLYTFLQEQFSRVSSGTAADFCKAIGATSRTKIGDIEPPQVEKLFQQFQEAKLPPPPTDCLAPIGVQQLLKGMHKGVRAEFYAASSREAAVYRGRPFLIEAGIAFGGELGADDSARVIRFANRVPLLFQQSACSSFKAVTETNWRNYDLQQPRGGVPGGALVIMIHMASVWVPFTSESKEAIADYDEIRKEMKLALMECGRKLGTYLKKRAKMRRESERRDVFERYIGEITKAIHAIAGVEEKTLYAALLTQARKRTAIADLHLDEEGKKIKEEDPADLEGVMIVEDAATGGAPEDAARQTATDGDGDDDAPLKVRSRREANMLAVAGMEEEDRPAKRGRSKPASNSAPEPALLDIKPVARLSAKGGPPEARRGRDSTAASKSAKKTAAPIPQPPSGSRASTGAKAEKTAKPRLRLDYQSGKPKRIDEGAGLF
ncbi:hypothetical protein BH11PLA1_BH11PLA1_20360 [soil metagenome]